MSPEAHVVAYYPRVWLLASPTSGVAFASPTSGVAFASPTADIQLIVPTPQGGGFLVEALHNSVRFLTPPYGILLAKDGEPQNIVRYSMMCSNKMGINDSDLKDIMEELQIEIPASGLTNDLFAPIANYFNSLDGATPVDGLADQFNEAFYKKSDDDADS